HRGLNIKILNELLTEALEDGRGHEVAVSRATRSAGVGIIHDDGDGDLWIAGGKKADERRNMMVVRVVAVDDFLRGAGFAGDLKAWNRGLGRRAVNRSDAHQQ